MLPIIFNILPFCLSARPRPPPRAQITPQFKHTPVPGVLFPSYPLQITTPTAPTFFIIPRGRYRRLKVVGTHAALFPRQMTWKLGRYSGTTATPYVRDRRFSLIAPIPISPGLLNPAMRARVPVAAESSICPG